MSYGLLKSLVSSVYLSTLTIFILFLSFFRKRKNCKRIINLISVNELSGLGNYAKSLSAIFNDLNINHRLIFLSNFDDKNFFSKNEESDFINIIIGNPDMVLPLFFKYSKFKLLKSINIGLWFWELDNIPYRWTLLSSLIDEVWVSSKFIMKSFEKIRGPVLKIPFIIDKKLLDSINKQKIVKKNYFTFIFTFDFLSYFDRKNPFAVVEAFNKAFGESQNYKLIIKSRNGTMRLPQKKLLIDKINKLKNITFIDKNFSYSKTLQLVKQSDCYISLHRSEGLGLGMAEAMYLSKPVIATNYSGNLEFMNITNSFLVNYKLTNIQSGQYIYYHQNNWADPLVEDAANIMFKVATEKKNTKYIALRAKKDINKYLHEKPTHYFILKRLSILGFN